MISTVNVSLQYGGRELFKGADLKFTDGNCYGLIGANGAGKSTFLKILSGEIEPNKGEVIITPGERMSVLRQDHFAFDEYDVIRTVLMGNPHLCEIMDEKEALYMKEDFSEEDGIKVSELEEEFAEMGGWSAESDAEILLNGLGVTNEFHYAKMSELDNDIKVKVLLAQALFGNPDILLMDEPTNHLDVAAIRWLEDFLIDLESTVIVVSHDRHFLNKVCTHIVDIDFGKIEMYVGNYDFWYDYTQIAQRQLREQNKKAEQKKKELQEEIDDLTSQIRNMKDYLPKIVQKIGYRSVQEFLKDFKTAKSEYSQYQKAIAQWKQETGKEPEPQPHGVRAKLAANRKKIEQEQKNTQRTRSQSKGRGTR